MSSALMIGSSCGFGIEGRAMLSTFIGSLLYSFSTQRGVAIRGKFDRPGDALGARSRASVHSLALAVREYPFGGYAVPG